MGTTHNKSGHHSIDWTPRSSTSLAGGHCLYHLFCRADEPDQHTDHNSHPQRWPRADGPFQDVDITEWQDPDMRQDRNFERQTQEWYDARKEDPQDR